jgi:uncharacterized repeat protein (TIGR01451 family)
VNFRRRLAALTTAAGLICTLTLTTGIALGAGGNPAADLDQCANGQAPSLATDGCNTSSSEWVNGNLGPSKSTYREGDSIPYRMRFSNLTTSGAGASYTLVIEWDTTKSGKHAIDYLTTWDRTVAGSNPCLGVSGTFCDGLKASASVGAIPKDPQVDPGTPSGTGALGGQLAGNFYLWGGTITAVGFNPTPLYQYANGAGFAGDKSARIAITFTATKANPVLAWGGHIATRLDWGQNLSAVSISGSPFHMRLVSLNGSGGNQDRSLSNDAVTFPGSITIIKDADPEGATSFSFTGSPTPLGNFSLVDNGTATDRTTFAITDAANFKSYTVTENSPAGWDLLGIVCGITSPNGGSASGAGSTATIDLKEGENATCTFSNRRQNPVIHVVKTSTTTVITAAGQVVPYTFTVTNTGNVTLTGVTVTDPNCDAAPVRTGGDANSDSKLQTTETWIYTCNHTVTQAEIDANGPGTDGDLDNTVTADSVESPADTDDYAIPVTYNPAINVVKSSTTSSITAAGQTVPYTFTVTNTGNVTLTGITVVDAKCDATPVRQSGDTNSDNKLQKTETWIYTCSHTVTQAEVDAGGNLHNLVTADSTESGPDTDTLDIPVSQNPHLTITKVATETGYSALGQVIRYTIVATNDGNVALASVTVSDPKVSNLSCTPANGSSLAPGAAMSCTAAHTIVQADLDAGHYANQACVDDGTGGAAQACDSEDVPGTQNPQLTVVKLDDAEKFDVGDVISYTIKVTNTGNVTLHNVTVTDPNASNLVCSPTIPVTDLAPLAEINCTASHTATLADLQAGSYVNEACADDGAGGAAKACDDVTTPGKAIPGVVTTPSLVPNDHIVLSGLTGTTTGGSLIVELQAGTSSAPACGTASPFYTKTFANAGNGSFDTDNTSAISSDKALRWCSRYTGDANNAARGWSDDNELVRIDFYPFGAIFAGFGGAAIPLIAWFLWSKRRKDEQS